MIVRVLVATALIALSAETARATKIRYTPVPERVAQAEAVVIGTVTEVEKEFAQLTPFNAGPKTRYRIARVAVSDELQGPGKLKEIRVAFIGAEDQPSDGLRIPTPVLEKDNEVILFLRKRKSEEVYFVDGHFGAVEKNQTKPSQGDKLDETIKLARTACQIMAAPAKALKSKDEGERMMAAWMLTTRYRSYPIDATNGKTAEEPVDAEESQAILEGLLLLADKDGGAFYMAAYSLNLSKEDGFEQPFTPEKAKLWIKEHTKTYRVKKLVPAPGK